MVYLCDLTRTMRLLLLLFLSFLFACNFSSQKSGNDLVEGDSISLNDSLGNVLSGNDSAEEYVSKSLEVLIPDTSELEFTLLDQGLVDIISVDPSIHTDIKYSTEDNFMSEEVYGDFDKCYLQPIVADMLSKAQTLLKERDSLLSLLIFDCVRPRSVQLKMWDIVKGTDQQNYVAPPNGGGSMHNYGAAIDLGLIHLDTGLVDMGTPYDFFGNLAQPRYEMQFLKSGELTQRQAQNRWILREVMKKAGFHVILSEWWHFNAFPRPEVRQRFKIVE